MRKYIIQYLMDLLFVFLLGLSLVLIVYGLSKVVAHGQEVLRDKNGKVISKSSAPNKSGTTFYRDTKGKLVGTSSVSGNIITYRDSKGRVVGTKMVTKGK